MAATPDSTAGIGTADSALGRARVALSRLDNQQKLTLMFAIAAVVTLLVIPGLFLSAGAGAALLAFNFFPFGVVFLVLGL